MKKILALVLMVVLAFCSVSAFASDIKVSVDNSEVQFDTKPAVMDGVLMLPLRFVAEKMGGNVSWFGETQTVFSDFAGKIATIQIGNGTLFIANTAEALSKAPVLVESRTLVPAEVFEKATGAKVVFDENAGTVSITTK